MGEQGIHAPRADPDVELSGNGLHGDISQVHRKGIEHRRRPQRVVPVMAKAQTSRKPRDVDGVFYRDADRCDGVLRVSTHHTCAIASVRVTEPFVVLVSPLSRVERAVGPRGHPIRQ